MRGRNLANDTDLEVDGCEVSLWETKAALGAVDREVFLFLIRICSLHYLRLVTAGDGLGIACAEKLNTAASIRAELGRECRFATSSCGNIGRGRFQVFQQPFGPSVDVGFGQQGHFASDVDVQHVGHEIGQGS